MIRIAIVDDDVQVSDEIKNKLLKYSFQENYELDICIYDCCESIKEKCESGSDFDIIFLDIEFGKMMNGIEFGNFLRNKMFNESSAVIFISAIEEYAMELFKIRPFDFLIKPITHEKIEECMNKYIRINNTKNKHFKFKKNKSVYDISILDIKYLESKGRKVIVHTKNEKIEFYGQLSSCSEQECFDEFVMIHKSYFINPMYIERYAYDFVIVRENIRLPVSRTYRDSLKATLM